MSLTQRQLEIRRTGITASDIRVLVGEDPYGRTLHDVWRAKVLGETEPAETEYRRLGNELEPIALRIGAAKRNYHILRRDPETLTVRHRERSAHIATPDAFLAESAFHEPSALGEAKVVGFHNGRDWGDEQEEEIPDWCLVQATWQAYVTAIPVVVVMALVGTEVRTYTIRRNENLVGVLVEQADKFLRDYVTPKRAPAVDGSPGSRRMLRALFPSGGGPVVRATDETELLARQFLEAKREFVHDETKLETLRQLLITACGDASGIVGEGWRLKHELRPQREVTPKPYTVQAYRHFDLRETSKGLAGVLANKRRTEAA